MGTICENRMDWIGFGAECRLNPRPTGGGAISSPTSRFLAISSKPMPLSSPNLQYPLSQQFYTLCENFKVHGIIVWPQMTSE